jgi:hypothetical protein
LALKRLNRALPGGERKQEVHLYHQGRLKAFEVIIL